MSTRLNVQQAHDHLLVLGDLTVQFANIHRVILYPDGHYENDAEHSFHLALSAVEIAASYYPELDTGLVSQFSIVHDLPEVYAGDVPSFKRTQEAEARKETAEAAAIERLLKELPPHTADLLKRYEAQAEPEARFVRLIDKLLPPVIHAFAIDANKEDFFNRFDIKTVQDIDDANARFLDKIQKMFPEFDFILLLREMVAQTSRDRFFASSQK
jgi:5'-deoxynucleotidase YfbR-like HD superfamily hydrolase